MNLVGDWRSAVPAYEQNQRRKLTQTLPRRKRRRVLESSSSSHPVQVQGAPALPAPSCKPRLLPALETKGDKDLRKGKDKKKSRHVCPFPLPDDGALELVGVHVWADVVGMYGPLVKQQKGVAPYEADASQYWTVLRDRARSRVRSVFRSALEMGQVLDADVARWVSVVVDIWQRVHSAPERYRKGYTTKYGIDLHTLCVLYDMRNPYGLRIPLFAQREWFGRAEMYEREHPYTTVVAHEPLVAQYMPDKGPLAKLFSRVLTEETQQHTAEASQQKAEAKQKRGKCVKASNDFFFENKSFSSSAKLMRWCITQHTHLSSHNGVRYEITE
jgi:hypothetical protein